MEPSSANFKGILTDWLGWGRKSPPPEAPPPGQPPVDRVDLGPNPPAPAGKAAPSAPPPSAPAPASAPAAGSPRDPAGSVPLTSDLVASLTRSASQTKPLESLWVRSLDDVTGPDYPKALGAPVVSRDGQSAFFASERALVSMKTSNGETRWSFDAEGKGISSRPLVGPDGTLYVCGADGQAWALDPSTGKPLWNTPVSPGGLSLGPDGSLVVGGARTSALDPKTGAVRWSSPVAGGDVSAGLEGRIYRGGDNVRACVAYDRDSGQELWRFSRGGLIRHEPTVGPDGTVYVGDTNGGFYALDPGTGEPKWEARAKGYILYPSTLSEDGRTVYVGSSDRNLYAFEAATGRELWHTDVGGEVRMQPALTPEGQVVLASDRNQVFVLDPTTGLPVASGPATSYVHVAPEAAAGHLVLYSNNHTLCGYRFPFGKEAAEEVVPGTIEVRETVVRIGGVEIPVRPG